MPPPIHRNYSLPAIDHALQIVRTAPGGGWTFDLIEGDGGNNTLYGTANDDTMRGFGGNDTAYGGNGGDAMYGGDGNDGLYGGNDFDTIEGGAGDDFLSGVGNLVVLTTEGPCDVMNGGGGIDTLGVYYIGFVLSGSSTPASIIVDISTGSGEVDVSGFRGENFSNMEKLVCSGPDGDDLITGGANDDVLFGYGGDDVLTGAGGDDFIGDSWGFIAADGGNGTDTFDLDRRQDQPDTEDSVIDCRIGTITVGGVDMGSFEHFEIFEITAGNGNDTLYAPDAGNDRLLGGDGDDTVVGSGGADNISGDSAAIFSGGDDFLYGGGGDDILEDHFGNNTYDAGSGDDTVTARGHVDHVYGGGDDDTVVWWLTQAFDGASYDGGSGVDTLVLNAETSSIKITHMSIAGFEALADRYYSGSPYAVTMSTSQFAQFDSVNMNASHNATIRFANNANVTMPATSILKGLKLADGGQTVDFSAVTSTSMPLVTGGDGNDTVLGPDVAALVFTANLGAGNDSFVGAGCDDQVSGDAGKDSLKGGAGQDTLTGGADNDTLKGGTGADLLNGGLGLDKYVYAAAAESTGKDFDTVTGFDANAQDTFDLTFAVGGVDSKVKHGTLSDATFNADLKDAIGKHQLDINHAVLFTPDAGNFAGEVFLIVDVNGAKGYQAGEDLVILLDHAKNIGALDVADFA